MLQQGLFWRRLFLCPDFSPGADCDLSLIHILSAQGVRLCGTQKERISRVAVCGGSGAGTIDSACALGADALVTGDVDHHEALYALERGLLLLDAGHGVTERVVLDCVVDRLQTAANALQWNLDIEMCIRDRRSRA